MIHLVSQLKVVELTVDPESRNPLVNDLLALMEDHALPKGLFFMVKTEAEKPVFVSDFLEVQSLEEKHIYSQRESVKLRKPILTFCFLICFLLELIENAMIKHVVSLQPQIRLSASFLQEAREGLVQIFRNLDALSLTLLQAIVTHFESRLVDALAALCVHKPQLEEVCFGIELDLEAMSR